MDVLELLGRSPAKLSRACPTKPRWEVFVENLIANFIENGRKSIKFTAKLAKNALLGQLYLRMTALFEVPPQAAAAGPVKHPRKASARVHGVKVDLSNTLVAPAS